MEGQRDRRDRETERMRERDVEKQSAPRSHFLSIPPSLRPSMFSMAILLVCALSLSARAQTPQTSQPASEPKWSRWFELQTATLSARYRFIEDSQGETASNQIQYQDIFRGRFKFDAAGRYSVNASVYSGNQFIGSWNNTGAGTGNATTNHYLKQL